MSDRLPRRRGCAGLSLLEAVVALAAGSILLVAMLQLVTTLTRVQHEWRGQVRRQHTRVMLHRYLTRDLPFGSLETLDIDGDPERTGATVPSIANPRLLRLRTRVRYRVVEREGTASLRRDWRWVDLHDRYHGGRRLLRSDRIRFEYRDRHRRWRPTTRGIATPVTAVRLRWSGDSTVVRPLVPGGGPP